MTTVVLWVFAGLLLGLAIVAVLIFRQEHKHRQSRMCTYYDRCPECEQQEEPLSNLDRWDRP